MWQAWLLFVLFLGGLLSLVMSPIGDEGFGARVRGRLAGWWARPRGAVAAREDHPGQPPGQPRALDAGVAPASPAAPGVSIEKISLSDSE